jgi:hypothetical protein
MTFQEAMEQREQAQKVALEALRNASATENVFRSSGSASTSMAPHVPQSSWHFAIVSM